MEASDAAEAVEQDLYVEYKRLQRQFEFLQVQEDYIKVRRGHASPV